MTLDTIVLDLRNLLADYCAQDGGNLYPVVNYSWSTVRSSVSVALYDKHDEKADSVAWITFGECGYASAEKVMEALILDRSRRANRKDAA